MKKLFRVEGRHKFGLNGSARLSEFFVMAKAEEEIDSLVERSNCEHVKWVMGRNPKIEEIVDVDDYPFPLQFILQEFDGVVSYIGVCDIRLQVK